MKRFATTQTSIGALVAALGIWVLFGWLLRSPTLVQIHPAFVAMVFNTALCFTLLGLAFILPALPISRSDRYRALIGWFVMILATLLFFENILDVNFGLDGHFIHTWLADANPRPGRMAPNTAIAFMAAGLVLVLSENVAKKSRARVIQLSTFIVLILGLTGLVGYALQLDLLYSWFKAARMAVHTAIGMILVGLGLWSGWRHTQWYKTQQYFREDEKIAFVGAVVLIVIALTAGIAGFATQQSTLEKTLGESLPLAVKNRAAIFQSEIDHTLDKAKNTAMRPHLLQLSRVLSVAPNARVASELDMIGQSVIATGARGVAIYDKSNHQLLQLGHFSAHPGIETELGQSTPASLLWDGDFFLKSTVLLQDADGVFGSVVIEDPLPMISNMLMKGDELDATGEVGMCMPKADYLLCYPTFRNPKIYSVSRQSKVGKPVPMSFAVRGRTDNFKGVDYRGNNVIGAYAPLTTTGLGIVVKKDTEELFQPIRQQLQWSLPLLLLLVGIGAWLLRAQITPLASRLLHSERDANDKALRMHTVMESVGEGIITLNDRGIIESFNGAASEIFGYHAEEVIGSSMQMLMPENMRAAHDAGMKRYLAGGEARVVGKKNVELPGLHKDGSIFSLELAVNAMTIEGRYLFVGIVRDITQRKETEMALYVEKERLRVTLGSIGDGVITTDVEGKISYLNTIAETMTGWTNAKAMGQPLLRVFHIINEQTGEVAANPIEMVLRDGVAAGLAEDTLLISRNGARRTIEDSAAPIRTKEGEIIGVVLVFHDVSQARLMAIKMTYQATHDLLTGLINRREFERRLDLAIQSSHLDAKQHTMLYLDLDQFKVVNDTCGHPAGDELLRQLTAILQEKLRQSDTLARLGGDEFGVLLESCATEPALHVAELLRQTVSEFHFVWLDKVFPIGVTIGLVTFSNGGITVADVLRMADAACYVAKDKGRNRVHVYQQQDIEVAHRQGEMGWIGRIQKALDEKRFVLYAQKILPLAHNDENRLHYEILLRMKDEDGGMIPPMAFIPAAERYGLMPALDRWVVSAALADCATKKAGGIIIGTCAINLSGMSVCDEHFLEFLLQQFERHQVPPAWICFEVTETAAITNLASAVALIRELRNFGCRFALDDFGSGMSSFAYLKHLPVNYLKIDGAFVKDMMQDPIDCAMVESINHIGHVMGIQTIAEFVENDQILEKLREIGVDFAQGYGVEKPHAL